MKKIIWTGIVIILAGVLWYFGSPLFLNEEIDEAFPTLEEIEDMTDEERATIQDDIMEDAANEAPTVVEEEMPSGPTILSTGSFRDADNFHRGSGTGTLYALGDGSTTLRLENFSVTNGPDLHVILSSHENPTTQEELKEGNYIDLGSLKGNVGNQNYEIPENIDPNLFNSVVIYCKPFHVIFSVASFADAN